MPPELRPALRAQRSLADGRGGRGGDVLSESRTLRSIVEVLGGEWSTFETDWRMLDAEVRRLGAPPLLSTVREQVEKVFTEAEQTRLSREIADKVRDVTRTESGWSRVRALGGEQAFPAGQATQAGERLLGGLANLGLWVVPVGELESWAKDLGGHGPSWVTKALEEGVHERAGGHVDFVLRIGKIALA